MDPTKQYRERMQSRVDRLESLRHMPKSLLAVPAFVIGFCFMVAGDVATIRRDWPLRNVTKSQAEIIRHSAAKNGWLSFDHELDYKYVANGQEITNSLHFVSSNDDSFHIGEIKVLPKVGNQIPLYYAVASPEIHGLYYNPSEPFWDSARRLAYISLFFATCLLIVVAVVVFYRPKKTDRSYLPAKIDASEFKMDA